MKNNLERVVKELLREIGGASPGVLRDSPGRVAKAYRDLTRGYGIDIAEIAKNALEKSAYDKMVVVKDIDFFSLCEHHLLPFFGKIHIGYIPKGKIIGLSKIPRIANAYARRLQMQERLTDQIAKTLNKTLRPRGLGVVVEAYHLCIAMRGVEKQNAVVITSAMSGAFKKDAATRAEFLNLIKK